LQWRISRNIAKRRKVHLLLLSSPLQFRCNSPATIGGRIVFEVRTQSNNNTVKQRHIREKRRETNFPRADYYSFGFDLAAAQLGDRSAFADQQELRLLVGVCFREVQLVDNLEVYGFALIHSSCVSSVAQAQILLAR
jgi:hypothetical protein